MLGKDYRQYDNRGRPVQSENANILKAWIGSEEQHHSENHIWNMHYLL
jgi:hypothetical protein